MSVVTTSDSPKFRLSIMTFSTDPKVYLPLTPASNRYDYWYNAQSGIAPMEPLFRRMSAVAR